MLGKSRKEKKVLKYFVLPIEDAKDWSPRDWIIFVVETMYQTIIPFFAGMFLVHNKNLIWFFFLVLPIYFRLSIEKEEKKNKKRIYVK